MTIRGILFDKDGTLLEFDKTWRPIASQVILEIIREYGLSEESRSRLGKAIGLHEHSIDPGGSLSAGTNKDVAEDFLKVLDSSIDKADFINWSTATFNRVAASQPFYPVVGVLDTVLKLKARGIKIGLSTADTVENGTLFLKKTGLLEHFDYIGADDGIVNPKPATDYMEIFCSRFGLRPEEVAVVGDTMADMHFASNSGAGLIIGVLSGTGTAELLSGHADIILDSVNDICRTGRLVWEEL